MSPTEGEEAGAEMHPVEPTAEQEPEIRHPVTGHLLRTGKKPEDVATEEPAQDSQSEGVAVNETDDPPPAGGPQPGSIAGDVKAIEQDLGKLAADLESKLP